MWIVEIGSNVFKRAKRERDKFNAKIMHYFTAESTCNVNQIPFRRSLMFDDVFLFVLDLFSDGFFFLVLRRNFKAYVHRARASFLSGEFNYILFTDPKCLI